MIKIPTKYYKVQIKGEAHSKEMILFLSGINKKKKYNPLLIEKDIQRRKAKEFYETKREEIDYPNIIKGVKNGKFTSKKMKVKFINAATSLKNYERFEKVPRPGHADFARIKKYGSMFKEKTDVFSGRMTLPITFAGSIAKMMLEGVSFRTEIINILGSSNKEDFSNILKDVKEKKDSSGAVVRLEIKNAPIGLGEPSYYKLDSLLSAMLFLIPGIKGISFGVGFSGVSYLGSKYNDIIISKDGTTKTNNSGGVIGGLSNGNDIIVNIFLRPASSISKTQKTINIKTGKEDVLDIKGNHDSFYIKRALPVIEAAAAITLYDLVLAYKN